MGEEGEEPVNDDGLFGLDDLSSKFKELGNLIGDTGGLLGSLGKTTTNFISDLYKTTTDTKGFGKSLVRYVGLQVMMGEKLKEATKILDGFNETTKMIATSALKASGALDLIERDTILRDRALIADLIGTPTALKVQTGDRIKDVYSTQGEEAFNKIRTSIVGLIGDVDSKLGVSIYDNLETNIKSLTMMGYEYGDAISFAEKVSEESGIVITNAVGMLAKMGPLYKNMGLSVEQGAKLSANMLRSGFSIGKQETILKKLVDSTRKSGMDTKKVFDTFAKNYDTMSKISFKNGIEGMIKMSKISSKMGIELSEILNARNEFMSPEKAIELVATLNSLGGSFSQQFSDPLQFINMMRNKPEEFTKGLEESVKSMFTFDGESFGITAEQEQRVKLIAQQLGISSNSLLTAGQNLAKVGEFLPRINQFSGSSKLSEDNKESLSKQSYMENGRLKIDFEGKELNVDELIKNNALLDKVIATGELNSMSEMEILRGSYSQLVLINKTMDSIAIESLFDQKTKEDKENKKLIYSDAGKEFTKTVDGTAEFIQKDAAGNFKDQYLRRIIGQTDDMVNLFKESITAYSKFSEGSIAMLDAGRKAQVEVLTSIRKYVGDTENTEKEFKLISGDKSGEDNEPMTPKKEINNKIEQLETEIPNGFYDKKINSVKYKPEKSSFSFLQNLNGMAPYFKPFEDDSDYLKKLEDYKKEVDLSKNPIKEMAIGGLVNGASHSDGGVGMSTPKGKVELEGGEFVINKESTSKYMEVIKKINNDSLYTNTKSNNYMDSYNNLTNKTSNINEMTNKKINNSEYSVVNKGVKMIENNNTNNSEVKVSGEVIVNFGNEGKISVDGQNIDKFKFMTEIKREVQKMIEVEMRRSTNSDSYTKQLKRPI